MDAERMEEQTDMDADNQGRPPDNGIQGTLSTQWSCQTDASWINAIDRAGLSFVLFEAGTAILFGAQGIRNVASPLHAKAEGLLWAKQEVLKIGIREVRFESDCEQLIKIMAEEEDWPAMASELDEIKALSSDFIEFSIAYIPRSKNVRADSLAKGGRSRVPGSPFVKNFVPSWLTHAGQEAVN